MRFVFLGAEVCRRLPSDMTVTPHALVLSYSYYCLHCSGLSPYSLHPCRAHQNKTTPALGVAFTYLLLRFFPFLPVFKLLGQVVKHNVDYRNEEQGKQGRRR